MKMERWTVVLVPRLAAGLGALCALACSGASSNRGGLAPSPAGDDGGVSASPAGATDAGPPPVPPSPANPSSGGDAGAPSTDASTPVDASGPTTHPTYLLSADGATDTYALLAAALGASPIDGPDCSHPAFGHHIAQSLDTELSRYVFDFFLHATPDNDRCVAFDRQRNEIKVDNSSQPSLKAAPGDTVAYQWKFRLDAQFQASPDFCHVHQIKGGDGAGASAAPVFTITPRKGTPDILQVIYSSPATQAENILTTTPLAPFLGTWVEANETIRYEATGNGAYELTLRRVSDGATLLSYSSTTLQTWPLSTATSPTTYCRPKWGIYRSLKTPADLRDEDVKFDDFCVAKGAACPSDLP